VDVTGRSTVSEVRNKNISSLSQSDQQHESTKPQLPLTRKERAAAAEEAALR